MDTKVDLKLFFREVWGVKLLDFSGCNEEHVDSLLSQLDDEVGALSDEEAMVIKQSYDSQEKLVRSVAHKYKQ
jgi:hypothetical protein